MSTTFSSRDAVLRAVRAARPLTSPLPAVPSGSVDASASADIVIEYVAASRTAGADVIVGGWRDVATLAVDAIGGAARVASTAPEIRGTIDTGNLPHSYADLDVFIAQGALGVAENGAVWLPSTRLGQRAALFLATRVVLLLDRTALVPDLHSAYARVDVAADPFGVFVAGPSKTADIEQSLVVGAHGPKSLTVLLLDHP